MNNMFYTVEKLIADLQKMPQDLPIFISGYESGFENVHSPVVVPMTDNPDNPYFEGRFQFDENGSFNAVILQRENRDD